MYNVLGVFKDMPVCETKEGLQKAIDFMNEKYWHRNMMSESEKR